MKNNSIDCFDINQGSLMYKKTTTKKPINAKTLIAALQTYYPADISKAEDITKFIMENRQTTVKETVIRKIDK